MSKNKSKGPLSDIQKQFIRQNCISNSDKWIAEQLQRSIYTVAEYRRKVGLRKPNGRPKNDQRQDLDEFKIVGELKIDGPNMFGNNKTYARLSQKEKVEFLKVKFRSTYRFKNVVQQLMQEELQFFMCKYTQYVASLPQGASLMPGEQDALYNLIIAQVRQGRYLKQQKKYIQAKIKYDMAILNGDTSVKQPVKIQVQRQLKDCGDQIKDYLKTLGMTREQRLKQQGEHSYNIVSLVKNFNDRIYQKQIMQQAAMQQYVANLYQKALRREQNVDAYGMIYNDEKEEDENEDSKEKNCHQE